MNKNETTKYAGFETRSVDELVNLVDELENPSSWMDMTKVENGDQEAEKIKEKLGENVVQEYQELEDKLKQIKEFSSAATEGKLGTLPTKTAKEARKEKNEILASMKNIERIIDRETLQEVKNKIKDAQHPLPSETLSEEAEKDAKTGKLAIAEIVFDTYKKKRNEVKRLEEENDLIREEHKQPIGQRRKKISENTQAKKKLENEMSDISEILRSTIGKSRIYQKEYGKKGRDTEQEEPSKTGGKNEVIILPTPQEKVIDTVFTGKDEVYPSKEDEITASAVYEAKKRPGKIREVFDKNKKKAVAVTVAFALLVSGAFVGYRALNQGEEHSRQIHPNHEESGLITDIEEDDDDELELVEGKIDGKILDEDPDSQKQFAQEEQEEETEESVPELELTDSYTANPGDTIRGLALIQKGGELTPLAEGEEMTLTQEAQVWEYKGNYDGLMNEKERVQEEMEESEQEQEEETEEEEKETPEPELEWIGEESVEAGTVVKGLAIIETDNNFIKVGEGEEYEMEENGTKHYYKGNNEGLNVEFQRILKEEGLKD